MPCQRKVRIRLFAELTKHVQRVLISQRKHILFSTNQEQNRTNHDVACARFPELGSGCVLSSALALFSRAWQWLRVFPRFGAVFPRLALVVCFYFEFWFIDYSLLWVCRGIYFLSIYIDIAQLCTFKCDDLFFLTFNPLGQSAIWFWGIIALAWFLGIAPNLWNPIKLEADWKQFLMPKVNTKGIKRLILFVCFDSATYTLQVPNVTKNKLTFQVSRVMKLGIFRGFFLVIKSSR